MKVLFGILLVLFSSIPVCRSQFTNNDTVQLSKLPPEGVLLDKGWKFHPGDDSAWVNPDLNDKDWQPIYPSLDIRHIPQIKNVPVFWLRLKLQVDSSLMDQPLGITISQVGASEIYLDGALLYEFGTVSNDISKERSHHLLSRPYIVKLDVRRIQTIAIRYSYNQKGFLIKWGDPNFCMRIVLNTAGLTFSKFQKDTRLSLIYEMIRTSIWLLLSIISLVLYFSTRSRKEYLLVGIFSFSFFFSNISGGMIAQAFLNTGAYSYTYLVSRFFFMLGLVIALSAFCKIFNQSKNWYYYVLMLASLFGVISFLVFYDQAVFIYLFIFILYSFEGIRRCFKAILNNRHGAIFLLLASSSVFLFVPIIMLSIKFNYLGAAAFSAFLAEVNVPLFWCMFVAGEFGRTSIALQTKVKEVEQLSQKAIAQERDKQAFLASQNETLELKVSERTFQLNESLRNLQSTQAQLIQSEKMASLGELTAGIAHEIQNPLNFVNNFSEVNTELIDETETAINDDKPTEAKELLASLRSNQIKINHHGKRADTIVKGMLQHSRANTGQKEATDLNRLVDEYLRISYQGLRTRDNTFNSKIETHYDQDINRINIIPQEIGRVLLNLYNNAFYAVAEKKKQQSEGYESTVIVSTLKTKDGIEIRVKDNGNGIPIKILDKIFQPFFTTKPTGQGTGLGLSLSYDIVKAHGGEIKVNTLDGEFTEFVIQLPI